MKYIIKRDGRQVLFDRQKIITAILKAFMAVDGTVSEYAITKADKIATFIEKKNEKTELTIEEIQDLVEKGLMSTKRKDVARAYITYREDRSRIRNWNTNMAQTIKEKLEASNVEMQNANVDEQSFGGRRGEATNALMKQFALDNCMSEMARNNHLNNEIYIHDLDSYAVGMHNCCVRETKFLTSAGVFSFEDFIDGDTIEEVLTHTGNFQSAKVHKYGIQKVNKITFSRAGQTFTTERFTANHRWLLADGTVTTNLKVGDKILKAPNIRNFDFKNASKKEQYYWCLGFVLGDGTEAYRWSHGVKKENIKFVRLRLCGDKTKYESRFINLKHSTKEMSNGDLYLTFSSIIDFRKVFPDLNQMTWKEKLALFDGLYCADGQKNGHRKSILTTNEQIASFIEDTVPSLGYYIIKINDKTGEKTNYKTRGFTKEFIFTGNNNKYYWTVVDIEEDSEEEVWCLDVDVDHSFILPNGIVTGNCLTIPFDRLLAEGFNTRQTDVRPANSVNTAFQLIAVIFQLQSLQQFGGVSASHIDWTMVPYVRKSFWKHFKDGMKYIEQAPILFDEEVDAAEISIEQSNGIYSQHNKAYDYALDMTRKEVHQAVEGMYHNLNTLQSRSGNQLPFTSINYGTCTLPEGRMVTEEILNVSIEGIGKLHKTPIFPCGIFQCMKDVNRKKGDPNYDLFKLALKSTARRLYPNYANVDWSTNAGYDRNDPNTYVSTMGK